jgi:hypothetical protein
LIAFDVFKIWSVIIVSMSSENKVFIVAITAAVANIDEMTRVVVEQTGDEKPFFCPTVHEGQPYDGHAHTFPPVSVVDPDRTPIVL